MREDLETKGSFTIAEFDHTVSADSERLFSIFREWNLEYRFDYELFTQSFGQLKANNSKVFVARIGGVIVGYTQVTARLQVGFAKYLEIDQLLVSENYRKLGVGRGLMGHAEQYARLSKLGSVRLESELARSTAHVFYERLGFSMTKASKFYEKKVEED